MTEFEVGPFTVNIRRHSEDIEGWDRQAIAGCLDASMCVSEPRGTSELIQGVCIIVRRMSVRYTRTNSTTRLKLDKFQDSRPRVPCGANHEEVQHEPSIKAKS